MLNNKTILIIGGTGSLGKKLLQRIMYGEKGQVKKIIIFSRDEDKQHQIKVELSSAKRSTHEIYFGNYEQIIDFRIGDVRDKSSLINPIMESDIIINAAALKHVPVCEYFPIQAIKTNILGSQNIIEVMKENKLSNKIICDISTDKACKPVNTYGMTKAIQERIIIEANYTCSESKFICVRYGNVMASRGSIIPLFQKQIKDGGPLTITDPSMTRFLMSLDKAVDTIFDSLELSSRGDTFIPIVPSATVISIAKSMIGSRDIDIKYIGNRPGEKRHEILISEEEADRTYKIGNYYSIKSILPEVSNIHSDKIIFSEYSSNNSLIDQKQLEELLRKEGHLNF